MDKDKWASLQELVNRKSEFIDGVLEETEYGCTSRTKIVNISLRKDSLWTGGAVLRVRGKSFTCAYAIDFASWREIEDGKIAVNGYCQGCTIHPNGNQPP